MTSIRPGIASDAEALAELAARTFRETFGAANRPEDMALYLARNYGAARQARELADPAIVTLLAERQGRLAGYAQLRPGETPTEVVGPMPIELWRFYVDRSWQGQGVAQVLMGETMGAARRRGAGTVWLAVWEHNPRAQAFYRKCGFVDVGSKQFVLGNDRQTDRIMARPVE